MTEITTAPPKSFQVAEIIRREILSGNLKKNERLCSTRKMAEKYSVTSRIVQSAFDILRKEGMIECHVGRGTFVASEPDSISSRTVVLLLDGTGDVHARLPIILPSTIQKKDFMSYVFDIHGTHSKKLFSNIRDLLREKPYAVLIDAYSLFNFEILDWVEPPTKLIFIRRFEGKHIDNASYLLEDYREGGRIACQHLLEKGRKKIAVLSFTRKPGWISEMFYSGVREILDGAGLKLYKYIDQHLCDEHEMIKELCAGDFPDGIICIRDFFYHCVHRAAERRGLKLGEDFDAVGYGNTPWAQFYNLPSIDPQNKCLAQMALKALDSPAPVSWKIKPSLVLRNNDIPVEFI